MESPKIYKEFVGNCRRSFIIDSLEKLEPEVKKVLAFYGAKAKEPLSKTYKGILAISLIGQASAMLTFRNKVDCKAAVSQLETIINQLTLLENTTIERPEMFERSSHEFIDTHIVYLKECLNLLVENTDYITV